jgi:hypothetical protein
MNRSLFFLLGAAILALGLGQSLLLSPLQQRQETSLRQQQQQRSLLTEQQQRRALFKDGTATTALIGKAEYAIQTEGRTPWQVMPDLVQQASQEQGLLLQDARFETVNALASAESGLQVERLRGQLHLQTYSDAALYRLWQQLAQSAPDVFVLQQLEISRAKDVESIDLDKLKAGDIPPLFSATLTFSVVALRHAPSP